MRRELEYHEEAREDIHQLNDYIEEKCKAPLTACRYLEGLEKSILWLQEHADIFPIVPELSLQMGYPIRRLNYEKMTVLYSIYEDIVHIHRIIPQSMVIY